MIFKHFAKMLPLVVLACIIPGQSAAVVRVFHSPNDDGIAAAELEVLPPGDHTLHLYLETGSTPSQSAPCDTGDGEEICQWMVDFAGQGSLAFQSFAPVGDVNWYIGLRELTATGGDFEFGQLGAFKLGDLDVSAGNNGAIELLRGEVALADLTVSSLEGGDVVLLPEPSLWLSLASAVSFLALLSRVRNRFLSR